MRRLDFISIQKKREQQIRYINAARPVAGSSVKFAYSSSPVYSGEIQTSQIGSVFDYTITLSLDDEVTLTKVNVRVARNQDFSTVIPSGAQVRSWQGGGLSHWWEVLPRTEPGKIQIRIRITDVPLDVPITAYFQAFAWGQTKGAKWTFN